MSCGEVRSVGGGGGIEMELSLASMGAWLREESRSCDSSSTVTLRGEPGEDSGGASSL